PQPRQTKVLVSQHEHFARHQEEPAARHRHHGIPHQPDGRERQIQLQEPLPAAEAENDRRFPQIARHRLQRRIKTERDVPYLSRKYQDDRPQLHSQLPARKQRHHRQHHARKKTQDRNRLQDVQQRNQHHLRALRFRGHVSIGQREHQAYGISHQYAH